jgi:hypothetical protein
VILQILESPTNNRIPGLLPRCSYIMRDTSLHELAINKSASANFNQILVYFEHHDVGDWGRILGKERFLQLAESPL